MEIRTDTRPHISNHLLAIISLVMVAAGNTLFFCNTVRMIGDRRLHLRITCLHLKNVRDKDGYHWLTGRVDDVINVR